MEVSTATIPACTAKSLIVRQLLIHCTCVPSSSFAGNEELVAVEDFIDVGNVLYISYDCLWVQLDTLKSVKTLSHMPCRWKGRCQLCLSLLSKKKEEKREILYSSLTLKKFNISINKDITLRLTDPPSWMGMRHWSWKGNARAAHLLLNERKYMSWN